MWFRKDRMKKSALSDLTTVSRSGAKMPFHSLWHTGPYIVVLVLLVLCPCWLLTRRCLLFCFGHQDSMCHKIRLKTVGPASFECDCFETMRNSKMSSFLHIRNAKAAAKFKIAGFFNKLPENNFKPRRYDCSAIVLLDSDLTCTSDENRKTWTSAAFENILASTPKRQTSLYMYIQRDREHTSQCSTLHLEIPGQQTPWRVVCESPR